MSADLPSRDHPGRAGGGELSQQILRLSLNRLTRLADELAEKAKGSPQTPAQAGANHAALVPIQAGVNGVPPLILIHPVGGSVMAYYHLARHLRPEQPVYAIENQVVFNPQARLYGTITEMAAGYLEAIQPACPSEPYLLGGYSMGGLVAFEM